MANSFLIDPREQMHREMDRYKRQMMEDMQRQMAQQMQPVWYGTDLASPTPPPPEAPKKPKFNPKLLLTVKG